MSPGPAPAIGSLNSEFQLDKDAGPAVGALGCHKGKGEEAGLMSKRQRQRAGSEYPQSAAYTAAQQNI